MKKFYTLLLAAASSVTFAQQIISFEASEGFQLGTLNNQNGWEVTEGSGGFIQNQVITNERASQGTFSFKNAFEPTFGDQWFPIFGAVKTFDQPMDHTNFTISYDVLVTQKLGSDFEFVLYSIDENEEFVPVAGVGIENRGFIYLIKNENYGFDYATAEWQPNQWVNVKIEVTEASIKYYINNVLQNTIANYSQLDIVGFNMLHNNFGNDAYYDNFIITDGALGTKPFENASVTVYPNPAVNYVSVTLPANTALAGVDIYNITGQRVLQSTQAENIDVSGLSAGTYFLKAMSTEGASFTKKVIKN
jgi:hypothetical protein